MPLNAGFSASSFLNSIILHQVIAVPPPQWWHLHLQQLPFSKLDPFLPYHLPAQSQRQPRVVRMQPSKSRFGSSSSSGFSFGASTASSSSPFGTSTASVTCSTSSPTMLLSTTKASTPQFSSSPAAAATFSAQPAFGSPSPNPVFAAFGSAPVNNNDQMTMEDSMDVDPVQTTPPAAPVFGQQPTPVQSNFVSGASTPSGATPFRFGSQRNIAPQSPSPFQASGSLEFNTGGSFSLGTGCGDKAGRKFLRVKHKQRKK